MSFSSIGAFFIKDNNQFLLQSVVGIGFISSLLVITVSYVAALGKIVIYLSIAISVVLFLQRIIAKKISIQLILSGLAITLLLYLGFISVIYIYI